MIFPKINVNPSSTSSKNKNIVNKPFIEQDLFIGDDYCDTFSALKPMGGGNGTETNLLTINRHMVFEQT